MKINKPIKIRIMALTFKSKTEHIEAQNQVGIYSVNYRYQLQDGAIQGELYADIFEDGRNVSNLRTTDGVNFHGYTNETVEDNLSEVTAQAKLDIVEMFTDPLMFD